VPDQQDVNLFVFHKGRHHARCPYLENVIGNVVRQQVGQDGKPTTSIEQLFYIPLIEACADVIIIAQPSKQLGQGSLLLFVRFPHDLDGAWSA